MKKEPGVSPAPPDEAVAIQLSLCQHTALEATLADIGRLQTKLAAIKAEAGMKDGVSYRVTPDGRAVPQ